MNCYVKIILIAASLLFISCSEQNNIIRIKGSDTEVNVSVLIAEVFHNYNPIQFISVSGGGSGLGIASLLNNTADIANSSRRINENEITLFKQRGIIIDSFIFAQDAIAFIVNKSIPIDTLDIKELSNLLNGQYINWNEISTYNSPVNIYGRQSNSGTHDYIKKKLNIEFSSYAKEMNGNAQILEAIRQDNTGIGYVGAGYVMHLDANDKVKVLFIRNGRNDIGESPLNPESIKYNRYYFQRPLYQYYKRQTSYKIKQLLKFEYSKEGIKCIKESGYYPANPLDIN